MKLMKTAEEMMRFCVEHKTGYDSYKYLNHFKVIENCLQADEYALVCFQGAQMVDRAFHSTMDRRYSFALTNKRLIMGQRSGMGDDLQLIWYKDLNDMEWTKNSIMVDAEKSWPCIQVIADGVPYLQGKIPGIMAEIKRKKSTAKRTAESGPADEIRKFKSLLDDGIITEEEFRRKKGQLLDGGDSPQLQGADVIIDINPDDYKLGQYPGGKQEELCETSVTMGEEEPNQERDEELRWWRALNTYTGFIIGTATIGFIISLVVLFKGM